MNIQQIVNHIENIQTDTLLNRVIGVFSPSENTNTYTNVNTNPVYTFLGNPEEDTILSKNVGLSLQNTSSDKVNVSICMYRRYIMNIPVVSRKINTLPIEYVSFFMEKSGGEYTFPSFTYKYSHTENEDDENNDLLKTACIEQILNVRTLNQTKTTAEKMPEEIDLGYKGFHVQGKHIFAFFDSNKIETYFKRQDDPVSSEHVWAIVDEIMNKQSVLDIPIDNRIVRLFRKNPILWNIQYCGNNIVYPKQFYALTASDVHTLSEKNYITETYPTEGKTLLHMSMALPYAYSDIFSDRYLFTKYPLPENHKQTRMYKRYACFLHNPRYIFDETYDKHIDCIKKYPNNAIENIKMEIEDENLAERNRIIPCIGFVDKLKHHHRLEIWGFIQPDFFAEIDPNV
jgi:hypothetical protein